MDILCHYSSVLVLSHIRQRIFSIKTLSVRKIWNRKWRWKISTTDILTISELDLNVSWLISSAPVPSSPSQGMQLTGLETRHAQQLLGCVHNRSGAAPRAESCRDAAVVTLINITGAAVCLVGCAASRPLDWQLQRDAPRVGTSRLEVRDPDGKNTSKCLFVWLLHDLHVTHFTEGHNCINRLTMCLFPLLTLTRKRKQFLHWSTALRW